MMTSTYKIGELAKLADCSVEIIRHYERVGLLHRPARSDAGQRVYNDRHLNTLMTIKKFRKASFSLKDIGDLFKSLNSGKFCNSLDSLYAKYFDLLAERRKEIEACESALLKLKHACETCTSRNIIFNIEDCSLAEDGEKSADASPRPSTRIY